MKNVLEDWSSSCRDLFSPSLIFWQFFTFNAAIETKNIWITKVLVIFIYSMKRNIEPSALRGLYVIWMSTQYQLAQGPVKIMPASIISSFGAMI